MIIDDLTHDDILYIIEHLHDACASRVECKGCYYADKHDECTLCSIPEEWRLNAIMKEGDPDD